MYRRSTGSTGRRSWYDHRQRSHRRLAVERLTYHALLAGLQALLAEDYTIAAAPACIALLRPVDHAEDPDIQRLR